MAVKRGKKTSKSEASDDAYEQALLAEGAPLALDLLDLGSTIGELVIRKPRKAAKKKRAKKNMRAKIIVSRTKRAKKAKKKAVRQTSHRRI